MGKGEASAGGIKKAFGWRMRASFTVEAAFVIPIALLCLFLVMDTGITLYRQDVGTAEEQQGTWDSFDMPGRFRKLEGK